MLDGLLDDWRESHPPEIGGVRVVGHRWSERTNEVKTFLARNHVPYRWLDVESDDEAVKVQALAHAESTDLPLVLVPDGETLRAPSTRELAAALGLRTKAEQPLYDLCIVGGGPAGLAAAVCGASEGLATVVIEREAPGGQAGQSAVDRELPGVPEGPVGCRPHPSGRRPGPALRGRDGAGSGCRRLRGARPGPGGALRRRRRDRGPSRPRRHRRVVPDARRAGAGRPHRARRVLRRHGQRGAGLCRATTCTWSGRPTRRGRRR